MQLLSTIGHWQRAPKALKSRAGIVSAGSDLSALITLMLHLGRLRSFTSKIIFGAQIAPDEGYQTEDIIAEAVKLKKDWHESSFTKSLRGMTHRGSRMPHRGSQARR